ncbi:carbamoyltransferase [Gemmatimonadota bacterium]
MIVLGYSGFTRDSREGGLDRSLGMTGLGLEHMIRFVDGDPPLRLFPLGFFGHDAAASIIVDGQIIACASEERFIRSKHGLNLAGNPLLPRNAIEYCLAAAGVDITGVDVVAHYCDFTEESVATRLDLLRPFMTDEEQQLAETTYLKIYRDMLSRKVVAEQFEAMTGHRPPSFRTVPHHEAHAASTWYLSGFDEAVILTLDGAGEVDSSLLAIGHDGGIEMLRQTLLPTSLGTLYLIMTVFLGFRSLDDEYKVMGLSSYGDPSTYRSFFEDLVRLDEDGGYSTSGIADPGFGERLIRELGSGRHSSEPIETRHADIAASLQESVERAVLHTLTHAHARTGLESLCMAGGVALNCAMNGAVARSGPFSRIFVQPASSDEGCSLGAAIWASEQNTSDRFRTAFHVYLGPGYPTSEVERVLHDHREMLDWSRPENVAVAAAREIFEGRVHGWFQGRMEFGPRALGNRSILADPRDPEMKDRINAMIKHREEFRPFAPAVLEEHARAWFDMGILDSSPFMLFTVEVLESARDSLPAVTHVDGTSRVQTVSKRSNPLFWDLISEFYQLSGVPVVLNTSFNVRNEPIVCTPLDAVRCFLSTDIDSMTIDSFQVHKV